MTSEQRIIVEAFDRHQREHHNADYEVCADPQCVAAYRLEIAQHAERGTITLSGNLALKAHREMYPRCPENERQADVDIIAAAIQRAIDRDNEAFEDALRDAFKRGALAMQDAAAENAKRMGLPDPAMFLPVPDYTP